MNYYIISKGNHLHLTSSQKLNPWPTLLSQVFNHFNSLKDANQLLTDLGIYKPKHFLQLDGIYFSTGLGYVSLDCDYHKKVAYNKVENYNIFHCQYNMKEALKTVRRLNLSKYRKEIVTFLCEKCPI